MKVCRCDFVTGTLAGSPPQRTAGGVAEDASHRVSPSASGFF